MSTQVDAKQRKRTNINGQMRREEYEALEASAEASSEAPGTFKRASDDVIKQRRIVKARRPPSLPAAVGSVGAASTNPFGGISLVAAAAPKEEEKKSAVPEKETDKAKTALEMEEKQQAKAPGKEKEDASAAAPAADSTDEKAAATTTKDDAVEIEESGEQIQEAEQEGRADEEGQP